MLQRFMHFWNFFGQKKKKKKKKKRNNMSEHSNLRLGEYTRYKKINKTMEKKRFTEVALAMFRT